MKLVRKITAICLAGAIVVAPTVSIAAPTAAKSLSIAGRVVETNAVRAGSTQKDKSKLGGSIILLSLLVASAVVAVTSLTGGEPASP